MGTRRTTLAAVEATYAGVLVALTYLKSLKADKIGLATKWKLGSGLRKQSEAPSLSHVERW